MREIDWIIKALVLADIWYKEHRTAEESVNQYHSRLWDIKKTFKKRPRNQLH